MIENDRRSGADRQANRQPNPSREELGSATDVISAMIRTAKGLRIYLPNNPVLIKFVEELNGKVTTHMTSYGTFQLEVDPFTLRYKGFEVYQNPDPNDSIAFRLHADGVRVLLFSQGLEQQEFTSFLEIVAADRTRDQDDDIVTQLWESNLPHVNYLLEEDFVEVDAEEEQLPEVSQQEVISRIFAFLAQNPPLPPRMVPKHVLMLTGEEASWLRKVKQAEEQINPLDDVIDILSAILAGVKDPEVFGDFLAIMGKLTREMFVAGEIGYALRLVRFLDRLVKDDTLPPDQRQQVAMVISGLLSVDAVQVLQEALDTSDSVSHEELRELLQIVGLPALASICELLGRVEKLKVRKVIIEVLVELGRRDPKVFAPFLSDSRWYLVRNVVLVLSLMETAVALEMIVGLISHREARIRREVLGFLERSPDPKAKTYILKFFRDESSALRVRAVQILARERHPVALKSIMAITAAEEFRTRELSEKKAVYEAIGELGSENTIPLFRDMLLKPSWFKKGVDRESAICATAGLMKIRNAAAALQLLEEARSKQRNLEIRGIIEQAIATISAGRGRAASRPSEV